jgi:hypothetical protein
MNDNGFNGKSDDRLDKRLVDAARQYNEPPETPRDAMWSRILAGRAERRVTQLPPSRPFWRSRWMWLPAAAAAVLVIGIAIGRFTVPRDDGRIADRKGTAADSVESPIEMARDTDDTRGSTSGRSAYQLAAVPVLSQAELLLTQFRTGEAVEDNGDSYSRRAAMLLMDTRFLLDSPAADDPHLRRLLSDLELVLTQIVRLAGEREPDEREFITDNMRDRSILPRLRANVPMGTFSSTI